MSRSCLRQRRHQERGYAMAALIVAMTVMAVMMCVAMPVWKRVAQREKEEELIFRGMQYVHALALFQRKFANTAVPSIDLLVEQRFLRKKYKDPITNDEFVPVTVAEAAAAGVPGTPGAAQRGREGGRSTTTAGRPSAAPAARGSAPRAAGLSAGATPGIIGVTSKSKAQSIRLYNGRNHYNEWAFVYMQPQTQPGQPSTSPPGVLGGGRGAGRGGRGVESVGGGRGARSNDPPAPQRGRRLGPGTN